MDIPMEAEMAACTARVEAGQPLVAALAAGGVVCLGPGVHAGPVQITRSVTLRGEPGAVLDGGGNGSVVQVEGDDLVVRIEALTLRGGLDDAGGGLSLTGYSNVVLHGCVVESNRARGRGGDKGIGGGVYASRGSLRLEMTTLRDNGAGVGSDLYATGVADVTVTGSHLAGDLAAREGAKIALEGTEIAGVLDTRGTTTRAPEVHVRGGTIRGGVKNDESLPAKVEILP